MRCSEVDDWCHPGLEADGGVGKVAYVVVMSSFGKGGKHIAGALQSRRLWDMAADTRLRMYSKAGINGRSDYGETNKSWHVELTM
jgi:hypothetical protein